MGSTKILIFNSPLRSKLRKIISFEMIKVYWFGMFYYYSRRKALIKIKTANINSEWIVLKRYFYLFQGMKIRILNIIIIHSHSMKIKWRNLLSKKKLKTFSQQSTKNLVSKIIRTLQSKVYLNIWSVERLN